MKVKSEKPESILFQIEAEFSRTLRDDFDRRVWRLSQMDQIKLVRFMLWKELYAVDMKYMLGKLLPYYWSRLPKAVLAQVNKNKSLGVKIATLTSKTSETILENAILIDFPDGENYEARRENRITDCMELEELDSDTLPTRPKKVLSYNNLGDFVTAYIKRVERQRTLLRRFGRKRRKMAWRGNPWL